MTTSVYDSKMANCYWIISFMVFSCLFGVYEANGGDSDPLYRTCVKQCENTGCVGERCFSCCESSPDDSSGNASCYMRLYLWWKQSNCMSNCRNHCMYAREKQRAELGEGPVKYHGKWVSQSHYGMQEPISVAFSALNFLVHFHGWRSFSFLIYYSLPLKPDRTPFYEYSGLFNIYGILSLNAWFWSAVFHTRNMDLTEKMDYSSCIVLLGYSIILAIIRSFGLRNDAARVMVAAPLLAFSTTHILYLCNYMMDYEWNMKVCVCMRMIQLVTWSIWAVMARHPCRCKLWIAVFGGGLSMLLQVLDFPPYQGLVDAHALSQASTIPEAYIWWSFIKDDAEYRTALLLKKVR